ncbi:MAG: class I SAM-dependent methyltransferase [Holosporales bacterium]|jgi:SAM-dependent methyltransferase|nr:class I SAM-dependent methyltransferase [Holosporales bacterium]
MDLKKVKRFIGRASLYAPIMDLETVFLKYLPYVTREERCTWGNFDEKAKGVASCISNWEGILSDLKTGESLLEVGPGNAFIIALAGVEKGAKVTVADRFPVRWNAAFHPKLYAACRRVLPEMRVFDYLLRKEDFSAVFEVLPVAAECVAEHCGAKFDWVTSNAVLEHLQDPVLGLSSLFSVTVPGGRHLHQIDLRYHWLSTSPLDHLICDYEKFSRWRAAFRCEMGCQWRHSEWLHFFETAGFKNVHLVASSEQGKAYLERVRNKLEKSSSKYANWPIEDLRISGGLYACSKPL